MGQPHSMVRRLSWLLLFRAVVATVLLLLAVATEYFNWPLAQISSQIYGVSAGTFVIISVLGGLLRGGRSPTILAAVHISAAVMSALLVVQATGGIASGFSFLFLLTILDGTIIGGTPVALGTASASSILYGGLLALQANGAWIAASKMAKTEHYIVNFLVHLLAFYLIAILSGYLAKLWEQERTAADDARAELEEVQLVLVQKEHLAAIGELSASIAHEIRNPLSAISGAVEMFAAADIPTRQRLDAIVLREISRLNNLIEDFLLYARPKTPQNSPLDLAKLVHKCSDIISQEPRWSLLKLVLNIPGPIWIIGDSAQLQQVLWNLVGNAADASHDGKTVFLGVLQSAGSAILSVEDEGHGISEAVKERLFEPFQTDKQGGTGLGLATVARIVAAHGGTIHVQSTIGVGTRFEVRIPLLPQKR